MLIITHTNLPPYIELMTLLDFDIELARLGFFFLGDGNV